MRFDFSTNMYPNLLIALLVVDLICNTEFCCYVAFNALGRNMSRQIACTQVKLASLQCICMRQLTLQSQSYRNGSEQHSAQRMLILQSSLLQNKHGRLKADTSRCVLVSSLLDMCEVSPC